MFKKLERHQEWWATSIKTVGPIAVFITVVGIVIIAGLALSGKLQAAILACCSSIFLMLICLVDLVAELIRQAKLLVESLENKSSHET